MCLSSECVFWKNNKENNTRERQMLFITRDAMMTRDPLNGKGRSGEEECLNVQVSPLSSYCTPEKGQRSARTSEHVYSPFSDTGMHLPQPGSRRPHSLFLAPWEPDLQAWSSVVPGALASGMQAPRRGGTQGAHHCHLHNYSFCFWGPPPGLLVWEPRALWDRPVIITDLDMRLKS